MINFVPHSQFCIQEVFSVSTNAFITMQDKYIIDNCTVFKLSVRCIERKNLSIGSILFRTYGSHEISRMRTVCVGIQTAIKRVNKR